MIEIFDGYIMEWQMKKNDPLEVIQIIHKKNFKIFMANYQQILTSCYYEILTDFSNTMMTQLKNNLDVSNTYTFVTIFLVFLLSFINFWILVIPIQKIVMYFESILFIFPVVLIEKNMVMKHRIMKLKDNNNVFNL